MTKADLVDDVANAAELTKKMPSVWLNWSSTASFKA